MKKFSDLIGKAQEASGKCTGTAAGQEAGARGGILKGRFRVMKSDDEKKLVFGWASVSARADGEVIKDWQGDIIEPEELENAAYEYVRLYRDGGEMHERGGVAVMVESVVFTKEKAEAIGIPAGAVPVGWWIGFKVTDPGVWEKVRDGSYSMFSIEGEAERVETEDEAPA